MCVRERVCVKAIESERKNEREREREQLHCELRFYLDPLFVNVCERVGVRMCVWERECVRAIENEGENERNRKTE